MSIKQRTENDVVKYIKSHVSDGKLEESLLNMAGKLGYSNATIHRTLKSLQEQGVIEVQPPSKPTQPNTIIYRGPTDIESDILSQGATLIDEIKGLEAKVKTFVAEAESIINQLKQQKGDVEYSFDENIREIMDMPDGQHQMIIVKKPQTNSEHLI